MSCATWEGSEEYRRVLAAGWRFLAVVAVVAFVFKYDVARGVVAFAIPLATRHSSSASWLGGGSTASGPAAASSSGHWWSARSGVAELGGQVRALPYGGLSVVGACVPAG